MYLRPGNLLRDFVVEKQMNRVNDMGRTCREFVPTNEVLTGVLSTATQRERLRWQQLQHPISHTIVQPGAKRVADVGDRLTLGDRIFYVQGRDDTSALGLSTLFYVEERSDCLDTTGRS